MSGGHLGGNQTVQGGVFTHPQAVDTFERVSALLGLPLALAPAFPARGVGSVGGRVWALCVGPTLDTDGIVLQIERDRGDVFSQLEKYNQLPS